MSYALLDWDNTLRNGFTLFYWAKYLCSSNVINPILVNTLNDKLQEYKNHLISHDQLAIDACKIFSSSLQNLSVKIIEKMIDSFLLIDSNNFFSFTQSLLDFINSQKIEIIIISGAPFEIVSKYKQKYHLSELFCYESEVTGNYYSGKVKKNAGCNKSNIVREICLQKKEPPIIAIGDSMSDICMFKAAKKTVVVGQDQLLLSSFKPDGFIKKESSAQEVITLLTELLGNNRTI